MRYEEEILCETMFKEMMNIMYTVARVTKHYKILWQVIYHSSWEAQRCIELGLHLICQ